MSGYSFNEDEAKKEIKKIKELADNLMVAKNTLVASIGSNRDCLGNQLQKFAKNMEDTDGVFQKKCKQLQLDIDERCDTLVKALETLNTEN